MEYVRSSVTVSDSPRRTLGRANRDGYVRTFLYGAFIIRTMDRDVPRLENRDQRRLEGQP